MSDYRDGILELESGDEKRETVLGGKQTTNETVLSTDRIGRSEGLRRRNNR